MEKIKTMALLAVFLMVTSSILAACQGTSTEVVDQTMQEAVDATLTAMPASTSIPAAIMTKEPTKSTTPTTPAVAASSGPVSFGPTNFPSNVDPLTGLIVADASILNRRPVMIKVANYPREGRPHAGLSSADIVFDYYIGEGGNRFLALFYGQDTEAAGPIRSGRLVDRWLVRMYQGVLGLMYAYPPEYSLLLDQLGYSRMVSGSENTCPAICSISTPSTVVSWFANTAEMTKRYAANPSATNDKPNLDGMAFATVPPTGGKDGHEFTMQFSWANLGQWKYDEASKKYLHWIETNDDPNTVALGPLTDRNTGNQLAFSNVVVMFVTYDTLKSDMTLDTLNETDTIHEINIPGKNGKMLLFRDGQVYEGTWKGISFDAPIQFFDANNQPLAFQPGNTWISVTGQSSGTKEEQPGVWRVTFHKP